MNKLITRWVEKLVCKHKWSKHHQTETFFEGEALPYKIQQTLICTECGKIKKITL